MEVSMSDYIKALDHRRSEFFAAIGDDFWEEFIRELEDGEIILDDTDVTNVVDNEIINSDCGTFAEYLKDGETVEEMLDRLEPVWYDKDKKLIVVRWGI